MNNNNKYIIIIIITLIVLFLLQRNCKPLINYKEVKTETKIDTTVIIKRDTIRLKDTLLISKVKKLEKQRLVLIDENFNIKKILNKKDTFKATQTNSDLAFLNENFLNDTLFSAKISTLISPKTCQILSQNLELNLKNREKIVEVREVEIVRTINNTITKNNKGKIGAGLTINSLNILDVQAGYNINNNLIIKGGYINNLSTGEKGVSIGTYISF